MKQVILLLLFLITPTVTLAHSPLESVYPIDGSSLKMAPRKIEIVFKSPAKLIKLDMYEVTSTKKTKLLSKLMGSKKGEEMKKVNPTKSKASSVLSIVFKIWVM